MIVWEEVDALRVRATFSNAGHTIHAELEFNQAGELIDFRSDDRYRISGNNAERYRWSTPLSDYRSFGPIRLVSHGAALWHDPSRTFAYIELTIDEVHYNVAHR